MQFKDVCFESKPCPLGCSAGDKILFTERDLLQSLPGEFTVVKCKGCGLIRTNPRPTPSTIGYYYPDSYSPYNNTKISDNLKQEKLIPLWKKYLGKVFNFYTEYIPPIKKGRMLEIGCASGAFLNKMALKGWEVSGIEFSRKAAENAKSFGYNVYACPIENAPSPDLPYNLVVGWAVFEHLHDPLLVLKK